MEEAIVGIAAEEQGLLLGPLRRDPTPAAEFIDKFGQAWDVKAAVSRNPRGTHIFNAEVLIKKMKQEISVGENIILDLRKLENNDLLQLYTAIQNNLTNHEIQRIIVAIPNHILKGLKW